MKNIYLITVLVLTVISAGLVGLSSHAFGSASAEKPKIEMGR